MQCPDSVGLFKTKNKHHEVKNQFFQIQHAQGQTSKILVQNAPQYLQILLRTLACIALILAVLSIIFQKPALALTRFEFQAWFLLLLNQSVHSPSLYSLTPRTSKTSAYEISSRPPSAEGRLKQLSKVRYTEIRKFRLLVDFRLFKSPFEKKIGHCFF